MAEAFGRAVHNRDRLTDHAPLSIKGRAKAERADAIEDDRWQRMADKAGAGEEFRRGFNDEATNGSERDWLGIINQIKSAGFSESDILKALNELGR